MQPYHTLKASGSILLCVSEICGIPGCISITIDCAVDLARTLLLWGARGLGLGPGIQLAPRDPGATLIFPAGCPKPYIPCYLKDILYSLHLGHAAVDGAAVDRAVDLARTLLSGAQGPGPRAGDPVGPLEPNGPTLNLIFPAACPKPHIPCYLNLILLTSGSCSRRPCSSRPCS
jgi:hypothetical protein